MKTLDETKRILADTYDPDELVGVLKIEGWEILERFEDKIEDYLDGPEDDCDERD